MLTDREKNTNKFIDSLFSQENWEYNKNMHIDKMINKYNKELDKYLFIESYEELEKCKLGGYIRFIDFNDNLKWGGIYIKHYKINNFNYMVLSNSNKKTINVCFEKNHIFYKKHTTSSDKMREIFISYL
jgi:hypothetical protein